MLRWAAILTVRFDTSGIVQITQALMDAGFTEAEIRAVMGLNALRVIKAGLVPLSQSVAPAKTDSDARTSVAG